MIIHRSSRLPVLALAFAIAPVFALARHSTEEFKLVANDGAADDRLGCAVDVHADTIVAGACGANAPASNSGAAYVFFFDGADFGEQDKLVASDGAADDEFGASVAIDGDTIVVGAPGSDTGGADAGAAYVFVRSGSSWSQQAKLVSIVHAAGDLFGTSVAIDGDTAVVGTPRDAGTGSAYVFVRNGTSWSQEDELAASHGSNGNELGASVSVRGDVALVGAPSQKHAEGATAGAAYVFGRAGTSWSQDQVLFEPGGSAGDEFGASCALSGLGTLLVGAPGDDLVASDAGVMHRYVESGGNWSLEVVHLGVSAGDRTGDSVDISYNFSVAGSPEYNTGPGSNGAAVLFGFNAQLLLQVFVASAPGTSDLLGAAVAADICWIVAGATGDDDEGADAGAVYVFETRSGFAFSVNGTAANPDVMTTLEGPNIGEPWRVEFDTTGFPTVDTTAILIYPTFRPTPKPSKWGEILVTLSEPLLLWSNVSGSGTVQHVNFVPFDPSLIGLDAASQGMLIGAGKIVTLTNGELLGLGCFGQ